VSDLLQDGQDASFDPLALERTVRLLSKTGIRRAPLSLERVKIWVNQFQGHAEKTLAWLILRHLIYRTDEQLESSLRQALKEATLYFMRSTGVEAHHSWREVLAGSLKTLSFNCGPPVVDGIVSPGKSGEVVTRTINRAYGVQKYYPHDLNELQPDDRYLILDDGAYTGVQLISFLQGWYRAGFGDKVAIVVGLAHQQAITAIRGRFPQVPLFCGELITEKHCLAALSETWVRNGHWPYSGTTPRETYASVCARAHPLDAAAEGFGSLGLMLAFGHGIPDDSLPLLWKRSPTWTPLIDR
jgi:hypothetical protein